MTEQEQFKVWWDERKEIVRILATGDLSDEVAEKMVADLGRSIAESNERRINVIDILCDVAKVKIATSKARKVLAEWIKKGKVNKFAICGAGILQRTTAKFIFAFAGFENVRFFKSDEEALRWLKEE